jgi:hypothetical protein
VAGIENNTVVGPVTVLVSVLVATEVSVLVAGVPLLLLPQAPCVASATPILNNAHSLQFSRFMLALLFSSIMAKTA